MESGVCFFAADMPQANPQRLRVGIQSPGRDLGDVGLDEIGEDDGFVGIDSRNDRHGRNEAIGVKNHRVIEIKRIDGDYYSEDD